MRIPIHNSQHSRAVELAVALGCSINIDHRGKTTLIIKRPAHTNARIFKIQRRRGQYMPRVAS